MKPFVRIFGLLAALALADQATASLSGNNCTFSVDCTASYACGDCVTTCYDENGRIVSQRASGWVSQNECCMAAGTVDWSSCTVSWSDYGCGGVYYCY